MPQSKVELFAATRQGSPFLGVALTAEQAAWVRAAAWRNFHRKTYADTPPSTPTAPASTASAATAAVDSTGAAPTMTDQPTSPPPPTSPTARATPSPPS